MGKVGKWLLRSLRVYLDECLQGARCEAVFDGPQLCTDENLECRRTSFLSEKILLGGFTRECYLDC